jgi:DNA-binding Lrp family transcriptional regulator
MLDRRNDSTALDDKDRELLALLRENARMPVAMLARELKVARTTVVGRIKRLEQRGIVAGYTVRLDAAVGARMLRVHVLLAVDAKKIDAVMKALEALPQVRSVLAISGAFDFLAFVEAETTEEVDRVLDAIGKLPGVARTQSSLVLSVKLDRR